jgi:C4-dicarboxylate-specific signal transduction histidine kinase
MPDVLIPFLLVGPILLLLALGIVTILIREQRRRLVQEKEKQQILAQQNEQLEQQVAARTAEIIAQRNDLEQALTDLKTTQTQLVQREKMASLGELTAGIAHEMQNPLNFVTNFSDLSVDLVAELEEELAKEHLSPEGKLTIYQLVQDLIENQSRIHQHGHRADRIVKSMLEHSRASSGQRQATNLNALVDESLRLAYHGWRAKSKDSMLLCSRNWSPIWSRYGCCPKT